MKTCPTCGQEVITHDPEIDQMFEKFWDRYPKKVGKKAAYRKFLTAKPNTELFAKMIKTIDWQEKYLWEDEDYIPHPRTWLNQERWNDEPPQEIKPIVNGPIKFLVRNESDRS